ncbi:unnamed protein product [Anisakis simplex]|uniref:Uncharacterized protein n=1 Tax=Anisakis simplex TaxID=6269 RepID=A0A3P6SJN4_ANISI|nr:unnamed protein product [Anisakis simplex]
MSFEEKWKSKEGIPVDAKMLPSAKRAQLELIDESEGDENDQKYSLEGEDEKRQQIESNHRATVKKSSAVSSS